MESTTRDNVHVSPLPSMKHPAPQQTLSKGVLHSSPPPNHSNISSLNDTVVTPKASGRNGTSPAGTPESQMRYEFYDPWIAYMQSRSAAPPPYTQHTQCRSAGPLSAAHAQQRMALVQQQMEDAAHQLRTVQRFQDERQTSVRNGNLRMENDAHQYVKQTREPTYKNVRETEKGVGESRSSAPLRESESAYGCMPLNAKSATSVVSDVRSRPPRSPPWNQGLSRTEAE